MAGESWRAKIKMELQTKIHSELDLDAFAYHPKIQERLSLWLKREQEKLEQCDAQDLPKVQGMVSALRLMVSLPEKILNEERLKKAEGR
jgi:hypothetical protein